MMKPLATLLSLLMALALPMTALAAPLRIEARLLRTRAVTACGLSLSSRRRSSIAAAPRAPGRREPPGSLVLSAARRLSGSASRDPRFPKAARAAA